MAYPDYYQQNQYSPAGNQTQFSPGQDYYGGLQDYSWLYGAGSGTGVPYAPAPGANGNAFKSILGAAGGIAGAASGIAAPGTLALGALQTGIGIAGLAKLNKEEYPEYSQAPEAVQQMNKAAYNAQFGFSPQEKANFDNDIAMNTNTQIDNARRMGGSSIARAVSAFARGNNLSAYNKFAAQDFANKRSNEARYDYHIGKKQETQDRNTALEVNRRQLQEQEYGKAMSSGLTNMGSAFNLGAALKYVA
jgi:hypothetical protein